MNRKSFAQSIENLFTLSFLVKDGRVFVDVDESGSHFVSPRNGPAAAAVKSGEVKYSHFVCRLDFADWELMKNVVPEGEELMPNRDILMNPGITKAEPVPITDSRPILNVTWIKKFSRNRGKVLRKASEVDDSPEIGDANICNGSLKRKLL